MKSEGKLLNLVCLVLALMFGALAGLSMMSAGNFISTDNLFFMTVSGMMAMLFLLVPLISMRAEKKAATVEAGGSKWAAAKLAAERSAYALRPGAAGPSTPIHRDAKGRVVPPDVSLMLEKMKAGESKAE